MQGSYETSRADFEAWLEKGNQVRMGKMVRTNGHPTNYTRKREGAKGQFNDLINLKTAHFGALSNALVVKKGKGKGKGNTGLSQGMASSSKKASDYIHNIKIQMNMVKCQFCQAENLEGTISVRAVSNGSSPGRMAALPPRYVDWKVRSRR